MLVVNVSVHSLWHLLLLILALDPFKLLFRTFVSGRSFLLLILFLKFVELLFLFGGDSCHLRFIVSDDWIYGRLRLKFIVFVI